MASETKTQIAFTETRAACGKEKQSSNSTLEECPGSVVNNSDSPSSSDEFPEGGLEAWATAFGA